jgi:hypothetical protein
VQAANRGLAGFEGGASGNIERRYSCKETFEKWSVLPKFPDKKTGTGKAGENLNRRNTWSILRTSATLHFVSDLSPTQRLGKRGGFSKVSQGLLASPRISVTTSETTLSKERLIETI